MKSNPLHSFQIVRRCCVLVAVAMIVSSTLRSQDATRPDPADSRPSFVILGLAAHPDDEDGATLAYYSRIQNVTAFSVFFTRGEGGQNEIGSELYSDLAEIRTRETLAAAQILGTRACFLGFPDFGFSKTAKETFRIWGGEDSVVSRLVYAIRAIKPDVIITNHDTITVGPSRAHGNHQVVGIAAYRAFALAADPSYHPEQLHDGVTPWQASRLFYRYRSSSDTIPDSVVTIPVESEYQTAVTIEDLSIRALNQHRSQGMQRLTVDSLPPQWRKHRFVIALHAGEYQFDDDDLFAGLRASARTIEIPPDLAPSTPPPGLYCSVVPECSSLGIVGTKAGETSRTFTIQLRNTTGKPLKTEVLGMYRGKRIFQHAYAMNDSAHWRVNDAVRLSFDHALLAIPESLTFIASSAGKNIPPAQRISARAQVALKPVDAVVPRNAVIGLVRTYDNTIEQTLDALGLKYTLLDSTALANRSLDGFSVILLDLRFGQYRPDAVQAMPKLLEYVRNGGNLISFYNKTGDWNGKNLAPFALTLTGDRVTEEDAAVQALIPEHPLLNSPNKVLQTDWNGWVQERNIYLPAADTAKTSSAWRRILAMHDEDEQQPSTSLLFARSGKGSYTYVALALYRQLRVLNSGGVKLFLNLIAQPRG